MIDDIVDLSQMEVNKLRLDESRFSIQSIQKDLKSIFNNEFEASGVDFQIYVDPMLPRVDWGRWQDQTSADQFDIPLNEEGFWVYPFAC